MPAPIWAVANHALIFTPDRRHHAGRTAAAHSYLRQAHNLEEPPPASFRQASPCLATTRRLAREPGQRRRGLLERLRRRLSGAIR